MLRNRICVVLVIALGLAGAAHADVIYALGEASTASFSQGSGVGQEPRGWDFVVTDPNVLVTQLGVNAALGDIDITLTLWNVDTQTELAQIDVTSLARGWAFGDLMSPVALSMGVTYSVIGWADTGGIGQAWYLYNNTPPSEFNPTGTITYLRTRYDNGVGPDTFPLGTLGAPAQYGVTDIGYTVGGEPGVPEPGTLALVGIGLALVVLRRLR